MWQVVVTTRTNNDSTIHHRRYHITRESPAQTIGPGATWPSKNTKADNVARPLLDQEPHNRIHDASRLEHYARSEHAHHSCIKDVPQGRSPAGVSSQSLDPQPRSRCSLQPHVIIIDDMLGASPAARTLPWPLHLTANADALVSGSSC